MILDSFDQVEGSNNGAGIFKFNFAVQGSWQPQTIGVKDKIDTVIEMQVGPFAIPQVSPAAYVLNPAGTGSSALPVLTPNGPAPTSDPLSSALTQLPFGNRVTLELKEVNTQAYRAHVNARHHFEFTASPNVYLSSGGIVDRGSLLLEPLRDWDTFVFTDPLKDVQGITLRFNNPDYPIAFPASCLYGPQAQVAAAAQVLQMNTTTPHGLNAGDRVYISNFTSGNAILDNYVNSVSTAAGMNVGLIVGSGGLTATSFRFNPDISTSLLGLALGTTISPPSSYFNLPWATGPSAATSCATIYGFAQIDTSGATAYSSTTQVPATSSYTLTGGVNNGFDFSVNGMTTSIALTPGTYAVGQLASLLQNAMNTASFGFTVTYSNVTRLFTISRQVPPAVRTTVCIAKNRIRIPLRLRRVIGRLTQYISP